MTCSSSTSNKTSYEQYLFWNRSPCNSITISQIILERHWHPGSWYQSADHGKKARCNCFKGKQLTRSCRQTEEKVKCDALNLSKNIHNSRYNSTEFYKYEKTNIFWTYATIKRFISKPWRRKLRGQWHKDVNIECCFYGDDFTRRYKFLARWSTGCRSTCNH